MACIDKGCWKPPETYTFRVPKHGVRKVSLLGTMSSFCFWVDAFSKESRYSQKPCLGYGSTMGVFASFGFSLGTWTLFGQALGGCCWS